MKIIFSYERLDYEDMSDMSTTQEHLWIYFIKCSVVVYETPATHMHIHLKLSPRYNVASVPRRKNILLHGIRPNGSFIPH
jgi:hypothetical protein